MAKISSICVFCGSGDGAQPIYAEAARALGRALAESRIRLVYGGGSVGLMGIVAKTVIDHGGSVTGIIPRFLQRSEVMLEAVDDLIVTEDMHERKRLMFEHAHAFVALPGGVGTLEETVEQLTWAQLGRHVKPIVLANVDGFWDPLIALIGHMRSQHFIRDEFQVDYLTAERIGDIVPLVAKAVAGIDQTALEQPITAEPLKRM